MMDFVIAVVVLVILGLVKLVGAFGRTPRYAASRPLLDPTASLLNRRQIRAQFNWSDAMIRKYLGEPDRIRTFRRRYGRTGEEHLFFRRRVEAALKSPDFEPKRKQTKRLRPDPIIVPSSTPEPADTMWMYSKAAPVEPEPDFLRMSIEGQKLRKPPRRRQ